MSELNKLDRMIDLTKDNINQLLWIGIHNNDGNINSFSKPTTIKETID